MELKKSKDPEIDRTQILPLRDAFVSIKSNKVKVRDRKIEFMPTSKTPFLEVYHLISLKNFR